MFFSVKLLKSMGINAIYRRLICEGIVLILTSVNSVCSVILHRFLICTVSVENGIAKKVIKLLMIEAKFCCSFW